MKKIDVNFKIFAGFIFLSFFSISILIYRLIHLDISFELFISMAGLYSLIQGCLAGAIFVDKNETGEKDLLFSVLLIISFLVLLGGLFIS